MAVGWLGFLGAALSGGIVVKILDWLYQEYKLRSEADKSAKMLLVKHLDPILKAADELVGKVRSLAQSDFREFTKNSAPTSNKFEDWFPYLDTLYLLAQFWSRTQNLRIESVFVNLSAHKRGKQLLSFFRALEAKNTRLIGRAWQRAIGETLLKYRDDRLIVMTYREFADQFLFDKETQKWFQPLIFILTRMNHTRERQKLLTYGAILHALIDTLDSNYQVTRDRPGWPNKLTTKSKRNLRYRVFRIYLPFVKSPDRYYYRLRKQEAY